MNFAEILIALAVIGVVVTLALRIRKSGLAAISTTNLLLVAIVVLLGFFAYQYVQSENREAIRTGDFERCWDGACHSKVAADAAARLSGGAEELNVPMPSDEEIARELNKN